MRYYINITLQKLHFRSRHDRFDFYLKRHTDVMHVSRLTPPRERRHFLAQVGFTEIPVGYARKTSLKYPRYICLSGSLSSPYCPGCYNRRLCCGRARWLGPRGNNSQNVAPRFDSNVSAAVKLLLWPAPDTASSWDGVNTPTVTYSGNSTKIILLRVNVFSNWTTTPLPCAVVFKFPVKGIINSVWQVVTVEIHSDFIYNTYLL